MAQYRVHTDADGKFVVTGSYAPRGQQAFRFTNKVGSRKALRKTVADVGHAVAELRPNKQKAANVLQELTKANGGK